MTQYNINQSGESHLYSLEELLTQGVINTVGNRVKISTIAIPSIQRAYAQGRKAEEGVRKLFLDSIFGLLNAPTEPLTEEEYGFIYGAITSGDQQSGFRIELIDGQQRITTLFLVHWYIHSMESASLPDFLSGIVYETRSTSTSFLQHLTNPNRRIALQKDKKPSEIIKDKRWFTDDFRCDATVMAMLTMLDAIQEKYLEAGENLCLAANLDRLHFYILLLEQFGLTEDLYIKMNARGLRLSHFENFKADLVAFMKDSNLPDQALIVNGTQRTIPFDIYISTRIDTKWVDLFWPKDSLKKVDEDKQMAAKDKILNERFMLVFARYFAYKAILLDHDADANKGMLKFFTDKSEDLSVKTYLGFDYYRELMKKYPSVEGVLRGLCKILDVFRSDDSLMDEVLTNPWKPEDRVVYYAPLNFTWQSRVVWMALLLFLEKRVSYTALTEQEKAQLRLWMHFVWKVVLYYAPVTTIDKLERAQESIWKFKEILDCGSISDIYGLLSALPDNVANSREIVEARMQAKMILNGVADREDRFEGLFHEIEGYQFFAGIGAFFVDETDSYDRCIKRFDVVKSMFDANGITAEYCKDHLLLRAMLGCLTKWGTMKDVTICEGEKGIHIRPKIAVDDSLRSMIAKATDQADPKVYLSNVIASATAESSDKKTFPALFETLVKSPQSSDLIDWLTDAVNRPYNKYYRITEIDYSLMAHIAYDSRYVVLDNNRHLLIEQLVTKYSYTCNAPQVPTGHYTRWNVTATKDYVTPSGKKYRVDLEFSNSLATRKMIAYINEEGTSAIDLTNLTPLASKVGLTCEEYKEDTHWAILGSLPYVGEFATVNPLIEDLVNKIENLISIFCLESPTGGG